MRTGGFLGVDIAQQEKFGHEFLLLLGRTSALEFLLLELVFAFLGFLSTRDLAGFIGLCTAVGVTYYFLSPDRARGGLREMQLKAQEKWFRFRLGRLKKSRGLRVVRGEGKGGPKDPGDQGSGGDPWVH